MHPAPFTDPQGVCNSESMPSTGPQRLVTREAPAIEKVSNYKAITKWENKKNIALGVVGALAALVTVGVVGLRYTEHAACKAVAKQQQIMQKAWDEAHSDGFVAAGDTMRPADFDCSQQERKFRPLKSYGNAAEWY